MPVNVLPQLIDGNETPVEIVSQSSNVTAAASDDKFEGAMIALIPSDDDLERLAIDGYESPDELHLTLWFLGDARDITDLARDAITYSVNQIVEKSELSKVMGNAFGAAHWNPDGDDACWVLNVGDADRGTDGIAALRKMMLGAWERNDDDIIDIPEQYTPWAVHICLAYTQDDLLNDALGRLGPITFDRIRVSFSRDVIDVPLK